MDNLISIESPDTIVEFRLDAVPRSPNFELDIVRSPSESEISKEIQSAAKEGRKPNFIHLASMYVWKVGTPKEKSPYVILTGVYDIQKGVVTFDIESLASIWPIENVLDTVNLVLNEFGFSVGVGNSARKQNFRVYKKTPTPESAQTKNPNVSKFY